MFSELRDAIYLGDWPRARMLATTGMGVQYVNGHLQSLFAPEGQLISRGGAGAYYGKQGWGYGDADGDGGDSSGNGIGNGDAEGSSCGFGHGQTYVRNSFYGCGIGDGHFGEMGYPFHTKTGAPF